jgi:hypothetical protein
MRAIGTLLVLFLPLAADDKPAPKFPLGKETTYVTGPLDKEGYIDYEAALNDRLGKGITPEKNANVLLWKVLGPRPEGGKGMPAAFFERLGIKEPPPGGDYFVPMSTYIREHLKLAPADIDALIDEQGRVTQRPWNAKDHPRIAAWLKLNEKQLALVIEATKRPHYFNPLICQRTDSESHGLMSALLPGVQKCRELATALTARAMLRVAEGQYDEAWQDLLACHRLGRLVGRGAMLIDALVGLAIDQVACNAELVYLERARLTPAQIRDRLKDLQGLPPTSPMADKLDLGERFMYLDSLQLIHRGGVSTLEGFADGKRKKPTAEELQGLAMLDWAPGLRNANRWYSRMAAALRKPERAEREKEFDKIEGDLKDMKSDAVRAENLARLAFGKGAPDKAAGKVICDILLGLLTPAIRKVQSAYDRCEQVQRNLHVAFALAIYHKEHGRYPAKLDELAPRYLAVVPNDLFAGKPLIYRPSEKGYLVYSVGANGKDEGGHWYDDDPPGDDPRVRMPLPELKPKKK